MCVCTLFSVYEQCGWPQMTSLEMWKKLNSQPCVLKWEAQRNCWTNKRLCPGALKLVSAMNWPTLTGNTNNTLLLCCFKDNKVVPSPHWLHLVRHSTCITRAHTHLFMHADTQVNLVGVYKGHEQQERRHAHSKKDDNMQLDRAKSWEQCNARLRVQIPSEEATCTSPVV